MVELAKEHRYDAAVKVVQDWLNDSRRDSSHDGLLYEQMAMIYIGKASKKPATRADSVHAAELNLQKSLAFVDENSAKGADAELHAGVELFGIGGAYEMLGDIADEGKCEYYERAKQIFVRQLPLIKGDSYTAYGQTIPLQPLRTTTRRHLDAVNQKSSQGGCQTHQETGDG